NRAGIVKSIVVAATVAAGTTAVAAKECFAPDARAQERAFSRAVTTDGGKAIWLGGQTGAPNVDFEGQVRQIFAELDKNIKAVGGSGLKGMGTMTGFITDPRLGDRFTGSRKETVKECFRASGLTPVSGRAGRGRLSEIGGIAVVGGK